MAVNYASTYSAYLDERFMTKQKRRQRSDYRPPSYTSMRMWMFMNYALLAIMVAIPILITYVVSRG